jgi:hypothetical protein
MNPLVKKEIRLLLPAWIAAMLLAIAPVWIFGSFGLHFFGSFGLNDYTNFTWVPDSCFAFGVILLGIASFGQEFSSGTFAILLSQPAERHRLWFVKILVLAFAFILVLLALLVSWQIHFNLYDIAYYQRHPLARLVPVMSWSNLGSSALYAAAFCSGGLWTTLLLRRMSEALWVNLLVPPAIMVIVGALLGEFIASSKITNIATTIVLALYAVAGFFWARRLFLRAQDAQWTGGIVGLPSRKRMAQRTASRPRHWFAALVLKELQLHQMNILIAVVVLALDLASVIIRKVHPHFADPYVLGILEMVWMLWLLMPLLIGSAAIAEEHRVGVIASQLCLPVSRRVQFAIKFFVALILSLMLGGVMPFIIEKARDFNDFIFIAAAAIFFISFFASTVARTTLQAIGLAVIVAVAIYFYAAATAVNVFRLGGDWSYERIGLALLKLYLGVPILLLTLAGLMYWNFKWMHPEGKLRWRNGLTVLASFAFIFVSTNGIYFRVWEWLTPIQSPHGPARLHESREIKFAANHNTLFAVLPDGRLWVDTLAFHAWTSSAWTRRLTGVWFTVAPRGCRTQFLGGSNWIAVAANRFQAVGIQSDGSLWSLQRQWNPSQRSWSQTGAFNLTRIGSGTNWSQASGGYDGFLLLKTDGSLWVWGTNAYIQQRTNAYGQVNDSYIIPEKLKLDSARLPARFGQATDWAGLYSSGRAFAEKQDGSIWQWGAWLGGTNHVFTMVQDTNLDGMWRHFVGFGDSLVGVKTNGELWYFYNSEHSVRNSGTKKIQFGPNAKWKAATFAGWFSTSIAAIRSDGTLWNWSDYWNGVRDNWMKPAQMGDYSNWVAFPLTEFHGYGVIALAADGSLWIWDEPSGHVWLMPPRKPVYLGNIFSTAN